MTKQPSQKPKRRKKAETPEDRENQLIAMAVDLAEKQLKEGKASTQIITHYLKLASSRERLEQEMLSRKTELVEQQVESLKSAKKIEQLYEEAIAAMKLYSGDNNVRLEDEEL